MPLRRPASLGAGVLAAPRRPARQALCVPPRRHASARGCAEVGGSTGELPPQQHIAVRQLLCGGDGGPCHELGAQVSIDTTRPSSLSPFSAVQKLIHVRFAARRCLSAPQRPICFSPSSHSQLLLEHAAAAFPGPATLSRPFNPACCVENLYVCSLV